jgi:hypothetical protein
MRKPNDVRFTEDSVVLLIKRRDGSTLECFISPEDYPLVKEHAWCAGGGGKGRRTLYAKTRISDSKQIRMHQLILGVSNVDHRDNDGLNNRRGNLRISTQSQNVANAAARKTNKSGFKGVSWHSSNNLWRAVIMVHGKQKYLGQYADKVEAAKAYDEAALKFFGEFANTNF